MKDLLPRRDIALQNRWKYQVQWEEQIPATTRANFHRFESKESADDFAKELLKRDDIGGLTVIDLVATLHLNEDMQ